MRHGRTRFGRWAAVAILAAAVAALSGCGDGDADQRKAFVAFLQTRIIDKPGIHVPQLTADDRASFGRYADQYAIISDFHRKMDESVMPDMSAAAAKGAVGSLDELMARRGDLQAARTALADMQVRLRDDLAQADAARGKLDQPDDVKPVFGAAYDRLVTKVAATFASVAPVADKAFASALDLGDYIQAHRNRVTLTGSSLTVNDPKVLADINGKLDALHGQQQGVQDAQARFQAFMLGTGG